MPPIEAELGIPVKLIGSASRGDLIASNPRRRGRPARCNPDAAVRHAADRFDGIFHKLRSRGKLTDKEIDEVCRELRVALLEADVNVLVARNFIRRVKERAQGAEVTKSLSPAQQVIKIVNEELIQTLGGTTGKLTTSSKPPSVVMAGPQGS